jgi:hypothetical protein
MNAEIFKARFDLVHRDVDRARNVSGGEFRGGANVNEQTRRRLISQL